MDLTRKERRFPPVAINFHDADDEPDGAAAVTSGYTPPHFAAPRQFRFPETPPPKFAANTSADTRADGTFESTPTLSIVIASSRDDGDAAFDETRFTTPLLADGGVEGGVGLENARSPLPPPSYDVLKMSVPVFSFDNFDAVLTTETMEATDRPASVVVTEPIEPEMDHRKESDDVAGSDDRYPDSNYDGDRIAGSSSFHAVGSTARVQPFR